MRKKWEHSNKEEEEEGRNKNPKRGKTSKKTPKKLFLFLTCSTILRICGSKPMSSILSASSSARYPTRCRETLARSIRSERRPGVATKRSQPRSMSRSWLTTGAPP